MTKQKLINGVLHSILAWHEDVISHICESRGWHPLKENEEMTVHYGEKEYTIKRTK